MKILGIDPGIGIVGFGCIETNGIQHKCLDAGVIKTKPKAPVGQRLAVIYDEINQILKELEPESVAIEKLFFSQNLTTGMAVSQAKGVIMLAIEQFGLPIYEYTPLQIKSSLVGYGKADKVQIQEMVKMLLKLKTRPKPDDAADALAAALTHGMSAGITK